MEINSWVTGKRAVSLPFTDVCGLVLDGLDKEKLLIYLSKLGKERRWKYLELRDDTLFTSEAIPSTSFYEHVIMLSDNAEQVYAKFRSSTKRNIAKAEKSIIIKVDNSINALSGYYRLHCYTRKRQGVPPQPFRFFENLFKYIITDGKGDIFTAVYDNRMIAGMIFFHHKEKVIYKYGASDFHYQSFRPNNLIMWKAVQYYSDRSFEQINLGRTEFEHQGLRQFKMGFSPQERVRHYYRINIPDGVYIRNSINVDSFSEKVFRLLPIIGLRLIGRLAYKHIG